MPSSGRRLAAARREAWRSRHPGSSAADGTGSPSPSGRSRITRLWSASCARSSRTSAGRAGSTTNDACSTSNPSSKTASVVQDRLHGRRQEVVAPRDGALRASADGRGRRAAPTRAAADARRVGRGSPRRAGARRAPRRARSRAAGRRPGRRSRRRPPRRRPGPSPDGRRRARSMNSAAAAVERRDRILLLAADAERRAAGDQDVRRRRRAQDRGDLVRRTRGPARSCRGRAARRARRGMAGGRRRPTAPARRRGRSPGRWSP